VRQQSRRRRRETVTAESRRPWFCESPDDPLMAEEAAEALRRLPPEERETVVARLWGGLSFGQVSRLTGVSISTAHRRYEAGLTLLRKLMIPEEREAQLPTSTEPRVPDKPVQDYDSIEASDG